MLCSMIMRMRVLILAVIVSSFLIPIGAPALACGSYRWSVKVVSDGATLDVVHPLLVSVNYLRSLDRPNAIDDAFAPRTTGEGRLYRVYAKLEAFKLEDDGDIHMVLADPRNATETIIAEIPDPRCMYNSPPAFAADVARARVSFVKLFGIPPVTHFRQSDSPIIISGFPFFDSFHGQDGIAPSGVEIHPVLSVDRFAFEIVPNNSSPASTSQTVLCSNDVTVWVNLRNGIYHLPDSRWFGKTREGRYICKQEADSLGYRPAQNRR